LADGQCFLQAEAGSLLGEIHEGGGGPPTSRNCLSLDGKASASATSSGKVEKKRQPLSFSTCRVATRYLPQS
jgi:hypothetical protein